MCEESSEHFHNALDYALERLGKSELSLMEAHYENIVYNSKDKICILLTGFGKSLIYLMLPYILFDYSTFIPNEMKPCFNSQSNMAFFGFDQSFIPDHWSRDDFGNEIAFIVQLHTNLQKYVCRWV